MDDRALIIDRVWVEEASAFLMAILNWRTKDARRKHCEFGFRADAIWVYFHEFLKLESSELSVEVNHWTHTDKLRIFVLLQNRWKYIGDQVKAFLHGPATDEDKKLSL